ncbi:SMP-30/gluconolactonase/LRE family protein [Muricoccus radiodurans]|uniref:SMP-30/gluconolactonase/LRE family protein n=1 Tax=Muricoccus radiodurans TaxID=2231721 RepID=UPI003CEE96A3
MSLFAPPETIMAEVFATLPDHFRKPVTPERAASGRSVPTQGCFLEGPSFDRDGNLYVTDIPFGRIFRISPSGDWTLVAEYDGEPNGLKIHKDGRIFVADYANGIMLLDPGTGRVTPLLTGYKAEHFKGVNDLVFARNGDLYFTDQGQTGLQDPSGRVYRLRAADGRLERLADNIPSPNGLVLNGAENTLYVAVTRANAVWRLPITPDGSVLRMGMFIQLSGGRGPDGMAMDEADGLAVAHPDIGAAWIFDHRGEPRFRVQSPRSDVVTNLAYGGPENRTLHIVDSVAGCILTAELPVPGRRMFSHQ